jgi:hypothetical protein
MDLIKSHRELKVYQIAFEMAMKILEIACHFQRKNYILLLIKSEDHHDQFVPTLQKLSENGNIQKPLFQSYLILRVKLPKHRIGSTLP